MKIVMLFSVFGMALLGAGCASSHKMALNQPVGPQPGIYPSVGTQGHLVVYSCRDMHAPVDYDYDARAAYAVQNASGNVLNVFHNDAGGYDRAPVTVALPAGEYHVASFVPGLGQVSIPVQIQAGQTTAVYLDGSANKRHRRAHSDQLVLLPNGDIAGYSAESNLRNQDSAAISQ